MKSRPYPATPEEARAIDEQCDSLRDTGLIETIPDNEPPAFISPCFQVMKKDMVPGEKRTKRTVVGYQKLNPRLELQAAQIPRFDGQIEKAARFRYKTKTDCRSGFWQMGLTAEAKKLTAFITPSQRIFRWTVLPMGITVAPGQFQELTNHIVYWLYRMISPPAAVNLLFNTSVLRNSPMMARWCRRTPGRCDGLCWLNFSAPGKSTGSHVAKKQ